MLRSPQVAWWMIAAAALLTACTSAVDHPLSVPSSPRRCTAGQLDTIFVGGGLAAGNDFGEILLWNPSNQRCRLHGPVTFKAYYADASVDTAASVVRPITMKTTTLPSRMPKAPRGVQSPTHYVIARLMGPGRDDPAQPNGACRPQDERAPATLELSIGSLTVRVANDDPKAAQITKIYGCHGRVLLEDLN